MPSTADSIRQWATENNESILLADGFNLALLGIIHRQGQPPIAIYNRQKCIDILIQRDHMPPEQAEEFFQFNVESAWLGPETQGFLWTP